MAASAGAQLERRSSVRRTQGMAQEEERGQTTADEELMLRSQAGSTEPAGGSAKIGAALDKDGAAPKSREQSAGPSGKSE